MSMHAHESAVTVPKVPENYDRTTLGNRRGLVRSARHVRDFRLCHRGSGGRTLTLPSPANPTPGEQMWRTP